MKLDLEPLQSATQVPMAVHGTTVEAWKRIATEGISKMSRQHIHMAQGIGGLSAMSGIRSSSRVLVYIDIQKALAAGLKFYLSSNGVVLTPGNDHGILEPQFFERVEMIGTGTLPIPGRKPRGIEGEC